MELVSYDFDETLIHSPGPDEGIKQWEFRSGMKWPRNDWWGQAESLNTDFLEFPVNGWTYKRIVADLSDPNKHVFVATGRILKLEKYVRHILEMNGIDVDEVYCNTGGDTFYFKCRLFERMIAKHKPERFTIYDDRQEHLPRFREWADRQLLEVVVVDVVNKTIYKNYK
jgi:hypothetical protein